MPRKIKPNTALLTKGGYLRLSYDLLPHEWKPQGNNGFFLLANPLEKKIEFQPANGQGSPWPRRAAVFSNGAAKSPHIAIREAFAARVASGPAMKPIGQVLVCAGFPGKSAAFAADKCTANRAAHEAQRDKVLVESY
jgi:hypothetical protein